MGQPERASSGERDGETALGRDGEKGVGPSCGPADMVNRGEREGAGEELEVGVLYHRKSSRCSADWPVHVGSR